jgi:hypothetical protein
MKKMMSIAVVAFLVAGSAAFACDTCGCAAKKDAAKKAECSSCSKDKKADAKKCGADCAKACCKKADA